MFKKCFSLAVAVALSFAVFSVAPFQSGVSAEIGKSKVVEIYTPQDLDNIRNNLSGTYIQMNDIDLSEFPNWLPIGEDYENAFTGSFNGNGHIIRNMTVNGDEITVQLNVGFFGVTNGSIIENTKLTNAKITIPLVIKQYAYSSFGGIIGTAENTSIENCYFRGSLNITSSYTAVIVRTGGIVGSLVSSTIKNCNIDYQSKIIADTASVNSYSGGITGEMSNSIVENCYNWGNIKAVSSFHEYGSEAYAGGIAGNSQENSIILNCYNNGEVVSSIGAHYGLEPIGSPTEKNIAFAGGVVGKVKKSTISNVYNNGFVAAKFDDFYDGCYAISTGIAGHSEYSELRNCYYNNLNSGGYSYSVENNDTMNVKSLSSNELRAQVSFIGFDFEQIWGISQNINNGCPYLKIFYPENNDTSKVTTTAPIITTTNTPQTETTTNAITTTVTTMTEKSEDFEIDENGVLTKYNGVGGNVVIPYGVTSIGAYSFGLCTSLTSVTIPNSVTSIGRSAFEACISLTDIKIPNSVTSIGRSAFKDCISLTDIKIPNSATEIDDSAFKHCIALKSVVVPNGVEFIGWEVFSECTSLENATLPNSLTYIGGRVFDEVSPNFIICGYANSNAESYAITWGIPFKDISEVAKPTLTDLVSLVKILKTGVVNEYSANLDINKDGVLNVVDLLLIKRAVLKNLET